MRLKMTHVLCVMLVSILFHISAVNGSSDTKNIADDSNATLLKMLHDNGAITDAQYTQLKEQMAKEKKADTLYAVWSNGTRFKSRDNAFDIKIGGRILTDFAAIDADREIEDAFGSTLMEGTGAEMRHARLSISGTIHDIFTFKAEYDFAGSDADFKDVWMGMKGLPYFGEIRIGHQKEPFSMEQLNNVMYLVFMERGLSSALVPGRNTGIKIHNSLANKRFAWSVGAYKEVDDTGDGFKDDSDYNISTRISGLPWYGENGAKLVHLGFAYSHKFLSDGTLRFRERPETHITDAYLVDTGDMINVDGVDLINPEIGFVCGPFSLQSEYVYAKVDSETNNDPSFKGYYIFGSFFLTGEHRQYRVDDGGGEFTRIKINDHFKLGSPGWGAWELGLRYSLLDLNDNLIQGGEEHNWTVAFNWYLNPNLRWDLNYVRAKIENRSSRGIKITNAEADIWMTRFQVYF